jgi:mannose-1-phosphate guanylyltransferase
MVIVIPVDANIGTQGVYYLEVIDEGSTVGSYTTLATTTISVDQTIIGYGYYDVAGVYDEVEWVEPPPYHGLEDLFRDVEKSRCSLAIRRGAYPVKIRWMAKGRSTWH